MLLFYFGIGLLITICYYTLSNGRRLDKIILIPLSSALHLSCFCLNCKNQE
jgi:hypothetical protein